MQILLFCYVLLDWRTLVLFPSMVQQQQVYPFMAASGCSVRDMNQVFPSIGLLARWNQAATNLLVVNGGGCCTILMRLTRRSEGSCTWPGPCATFTQMALFRLTLCASASTPLCNKLRIEQHAYPATSSTAEAVTDCWQCKRSSALEVHSSVQGVVTLGAVQDIGWVGGSKGQEFEQMMLRRHDCRRPGLE